MTTDFNINGYVRVKLSELGIQIYREAYSGIAKYGLEVKDPPVDEEGYSKFQLWHLMELYGPHLHLAAWPTPFDTTIRIELANA